ncbi:COL4A2 isoform 8, partial [Pan troglodytes]
GDPGQHGLPGFPGLKVRSNFIMKLARHSEASPGVPFLPFIS